VNAEHPTAVAKSPSQDVAGVPRDPGLNRIGWLAVLTCGIYLGILCLSPRFQPPASLQSRPILAVLALFGLATGVYLVAIRVALRATQDLWLEVAIFATSLAFRLILLPSTPIQEVDVYRYLWDGATLQQGISPYRFAPAEVRSAMRAIPDAAGRFAEGDISSEPAVEAARKASSRGAGQGGLSSGLARSGQADAQPPLDRLADRARSSPALQEILDRVHFAELPSVYPPVSQAVFVAATVTTPDTVSVAGRILVFKIWLLGFDMGTLLLVMALLRRHARPPGLSLLYGWCPLVIKEFANSGHLDAIAVMLTTGSIVLVLWHPASTHRCKRPVVSLAAAVMLALAIGAKLYPVILAPWFAAVIARRCGWRWLPVAGLAWTLSVAAVLFPMLRPAVPGSPPHADSPPRVKASDLTESPAPESSAAGDHDPMRGLKAFLQRWEMNDFLFLIVIENIKPEEVVPEDQRAWFSWIPQTPRRRLTEAISQRFDVDVWQAAFFAARAVTTIVFLALAGWFVRCTWVSGQGRGVEVLEYAFLTIAWFWLLSPTQNPWYWTWAMPLIAFTRNRVWWLLSGLLFLYYLRFWLSYHDGEGQLGWCGYRGVACFDLVVTWIEFGPWFVCLGVAAMLRRVRQRQKIQGTGASTDKLVLP
jgi:hypothetical protein